MNKLFVISGHSGAGKTSVMRRVMNKDSEIISVTTRPMREGEVDGEDYFFITQEQFDYLDKNNELVEKTTYYGRSSYAVTKEEVEDKLSNGDAYIVVDYNGMTQLKEEYGDRIVSIFLYVDKSTAFDRMRFRGDSELSATERLDTYERELLNRGQYDYVIKNKILGNTCRAISSLIYGENENVIKLS